MKYLMKVGDQLDLGVSYDGGAVDGVSYNAPDGIDNKVSVNALGVVTALGLGEGVVNVLSGGAIVGSIAFEVLTSAAYTAQQGIRDGSKAFVVNAAAVAQAPTYTLVSGGTAYGTGYAFSVDNAFDGVDATYWESLAQFSAVTNADCFIGKQFATPKQIKKLRVIWRIPPTEVDVIVADGSSPVSGGITIMTIPVVYADDTVQAYMQAYDIILPSYVAKTGLYLRPKTSTAVPGTYWASNGGVIDRFRVTQIEFYE